MSEFWNAPICEACWLEQNPPEETDESISFRAPVRLKDPMPEVCGFCGNWTIVGIYKRASMDETPFIASKDSS